MRTDRQATTVRPLAGPLPRRGAVLALVIVALAIMGMLMLAVTQMAAFEHRQFQLRQRRVQARWLAETALDRAAARLAADPDYGGEQWNVAGDDLTGLPAQATIKVEPDREQPGRRRVSVLVQLPDASPGALRVESQITIDLPTGGTSP